MNLHSIGAFACAMLDFHWILFLNQIVSECFYEILRIGTHLSMSFQLLLLGAFLGLIAAQGSPPACVGWTFACHLYEWEELNNPGPVKHAFAKLNQDYFDANCLPANKCTDECFNPPYDGTNWRAKKQNELYPCDITSLFCTDPPNAPCIPSINVTRFLDNDVSATAISTRRRRHSDGIEEGVRARRALTKDATDAGYSITVKTFVRPVCTRAMSKSLCDELVKLGGLCTTKLQTISCLMAEKPLDSGLPKNIDQTALVQDKIWESTGLPYDIVTDRTSDFLPGRSTDESQPCPKYALQTTNCLVLPICNGPEDAKCEVACDKEVLTATSLDFLKSCRLLDIPFYPLHRQGNPPYARWMTYKENFDRRFFKIGNISGIKVANVSDSFRLKRQNVPNPLLAYPKPIDMQNLSEDLRKLVSKNIWLNDATNPFHKVYSDMKSRSVPKCDAGVYSWDTEFNEKICMENKPNVHVKKKVRVSVIVGFAMFGVTILVIAFMVAAFCLCRRIANKRKTAKLPETKQASKDGANPEAQEGNA